MANYHTIKLPIQYIPKSHVSDNLNIILNTIFFMRNLQTTHPIEAKSDFLPVWYTLSDNKYIRHSINSIITMLLKEPETKDKVVVLSFYATSREKMLFYTTDKKIYWEKWYIPYTFIKKEDLELEKKIIDATIMHIASESTKSFDMIPFDGAKDNTVVIDSDVESRLDGYHLTSLKPLVNYSITIRNDHKPEDKQRSPLLSFIIDT